MAQSLNCFATMLNGLKNFHFFFCTVIFWQPITKATSTESATATTFAQKDNSPSGMAHLTSREETLTKYIAESYFFNQYHPSFKTAGYQTESLCGPVSVLNWLQLRRLSTKLPPLSLSEAHQLLKQFRLFLRTKNKALDQGLEVEILQSLLTTASLFPNDKPTEANPTTVNFENILTSEPALLLIGTFERTINKIPFQDSEAMAPNFHYVLRVSANTKNQMIYFIDSENPHHLSQLKLVENRNRQISSRWLLEVVSDNISLEFQRPPGIRTFSTVVSILNLK